MGRAESLNIFPGRLNLKVGEVTPGRAPGRVVIIDPSGIDLRLGQKFHLHLNGPKLVTPVGRVVEADKLSDEQFREIKDHL